MLLESPKLIILARRKFKKLQYNKLPLYYIIIECSLLVASMQNSFKK